MTINDIRLAALITEIHKNNRVLDNYTANGYEGALFCALMLLRDAAEDAMKRLNDIRHDKTKMPMMARVRELYGDPMGS